MEIIYPETEKKAIHPIAIFKEGFGLWRRNFLALSGIYLLVSLPAIAVQILFLAKTTYGLRQNLGSSLSNIGLILVSWLLNGWVFVALVIAVNKVIVDADCKIMENIKEARKRFLYYLGATFLFVFLLSVIYAIFSISAALLITSWKLKKIFGMVIFSLTTISCIVAAVYFAIRLSLGSVISAIEDKGPMGALRRSHSLIKNYVVAVVGEHCLLMMLYVLFVILLISLAVLSLAVFGKDSINLVFLLSYVYLAGIVLTPLCISISVILYKKLKEAATYGTK